MTSLPPTPEELIEPPKKAKGPYAHTGLSLLDSSNGLEDVVPQRLEELWRDPLVGMTVGNYELLTKIGQGGFGAVYQAKQTFLGEPAAVKVVRITGGQFRDTQTLIKRFRLEAKTLARLDHPGIVRMLDFGLIPEVGLYLAMELLEGVSLQNLLKQNPNPPLLQIKEVIRQLCGILSFLHSRGVIHRDLKPANMILLKDEQGQSSALKLIDFGIAALQSSAREQITKTGMVVGTAGYAAPEFIQGKQVDGRADLYALAVIMFSMLTQTFPFDADNEVGLIYQQLYEEPRSLTASCPGRSWAPELESFLTRCLSRDPMDRPADASVFWQECEAALQSQIMWHEHPETVRVLQQIPVRQGLAPVQNTPKQSLLTPLLTGSVSTESAGVSDTLDTRDVPPGPHIPGSPASHETGPSEDLSPAWDTKGLYDEPTFEDPFGDTILTVANQKSEQSQPPRGARGAWVWALVFVVPVLFVYLWWFVASDQEQPKVPLVTRPISRVLPERPIPKRSSPLPANQGLPAPPLVAQRAIPIKREPSPTKRPRPTRRRVVRQKRRRRSRVRIRRRRVPRRNPVSRVPAVVAVGKPKVTHPCEYFSTEHQERWIFGQHPQTKRLSLRFLGCATCKKRRFRRGWCLWLPPGRASVRVRVHARGWQYCKHSLLYQKRLFTWRLKPKQLNGLANPYYKCTSH